MLELHQGEAELVSQPVYIIFCRLPKKFGRRTFSDAPNEVPLVTDVAQLPKAPFGAVGKGRITSAGTDFRHRRKAVHSSSGRRSFSSSVVLAPPPFGAPLSSYSVTGLCWPRAHQYFFASLSPPPPRLGQGTSVFLWPFNPISLWVDWIKV